MNFFNALTRESIFHMVFYTEALFSQISSAYIQMKLVNYLSEIDAGRCSGCRKCETVCPAGAISVENRFARVDAGRCLACTKCWHLCPEDAVTMVERSEEMMVGVDFDEVDETAVAELCQKAHVYPEQFVCACTLTLAKEVAAAIIKGASTPEEVTAATGVRSGCAIYCMGAILRMLKAAGKHPVPPKNHRWYDLSLSLWDVKDQIAEKYPRYYLAEDRDEMHE